MLILKIIFVLTFFGQVLSQTSVGCPVTHSGNTGLLQTGNFPNNFRVGYTCYWTLTATTGVLQLDIIVHDVSNYLFLTIYDGPNELSPLIANISGVNVRQTLLTTSNKAYVFFRQYNYAPFFYESRKGFQIYYRQMNPVPSFSFVTGGGTSNYDVYNGVLNAGAVQLVSNVPSKVGGMWSKTTFSYDNFAALVKFQIGSVSATNSEGLGLFIAGDISIDRSNSSGSAYTLNWSNFQGLAAFVRPASNSVFAAYAPTVSSNGVKNNCTAELKTTPCGSHALLRGGTTSLLVTLTNGINMSETICQNGQLCGPILSNYGLALPLTNISQPLYFGVGAWSSASAYETVTVQSITLYTAAVVCPFGCPSRMFCSATGSCICEYGWEGDNCTIPACNPPCENNGTCVTQGTCSCPPGFTGTLCDRLVCITNSTINATATSNGYIQSTNYPSNYYNENCGWLIVASVGSVIQLDINIEGIGSDDLLTVYSEPDDSTKLMATLTNIMFHRFTLLTPGNLAFIRFTADDSYGVDDDGFRLVYKVVSYQPLYSYNMSGNVSNWNIYLPYSAPPFTQPDNTVRLLNATGNQNGAMWTNTAFTAGNFILNAVIEIGSTGTTTDGIALFVVSNSTIRRPASPEYVVGSEYYIDWNNFSGFGVFANPTSSAIYAATSATFATSLTNMKSCSSNYTKKLACSGQSLRTSFNLTVAMIASKNLTATICRNGSQCTQALSWETSFSPGTSLAQSTPPLYFGLAATNAATFDYVIIREVKVYTPTVTCTNSCSGNGFCYGSNQCECVYGWQGSYCQTPICSPLCENGGTCVLPFFCSCPANFIGALCDTPYCQSNTSITVTTTGSFTSDNYATGGNYMDGVHCGFHLTAAAGYVIQLSIVMKTMDDNDYIQIYDSYVNETNEGTLIFKGSGNNYDAKITSIGSSIFFWFISDMNGLSGLGFTVSYSRILNSTTLDGRLSGSIESAGYSTGGAHANNEDSSWFIQTPTGPYFWFTVDTKNFDSVDAVWLYDGDSTSSPQMVKISDRYATYSYQNDNPMATIRFTSDTISTFPGGWKVTFEQAKPSIAGCSTPSSLTAASGNFSNPTSLALYHRNSTCSWVITVASGSVISMELAVTRLGGPDSDYLYVYDGPDESSTNILQTSATHFKSNIVTTTNVAFVKFVPNSDYRVGTGFTISYNTVAPTTSPALLQVIVQSYNYPTTGYLNPQTDEKWYIRYPAGSVLNVDANADLQPSYDYFRIYEGLTNATAIGTFNSRYVQRFYTTTGSDMLMTFNSDQATAYGGFKVILTQVLPASITRCSSYNITNSRNGSVELPSYTNGLYYAHNENCEWQIIVNPSYGIWIDLTTASVDPSDSVKIYDGPTTTSRLLANVFYNNQQHAYVTTSNVALVKFVSDGPWAVGKGFRIDFRQVTYVPFFSYATTGNYTDDWFVSVTHGNTVLQADNSLRLTTSTASTQNGAMWAMRRFLIIDFIIDVNVKIASSASNGPGVGVMILRNSTTKQPSTTVSSQYAIDWTQYAGLSLIANPQLNSIYGVFSGAVAGRSHSSCTGTDHIFGTCSAQTGMTGSTLSMTMAVTSGTKFTSSYCVNGANCGSVFNYTTLSGSMSSIVSSPTVFGLTGYASGTPRNAIDIASVAFWVPTTDCPPGCFSNTSVCIASTCNCLNGWTGALCDVPICSMGCLNGGTCVLPEVCDCVDGYIGSICQYTHCITNVTLNATTAGYVESDRYNISYWDNTKCGWLIQGSPGTVIKLSLFMGTMDRFGDVLSFYDDDSMTALLLQTRASYFLLNFTTPHPSVFIYFTSDSNYLTGSGFRIYYEEIPEVKMSGFIQSRNYPIGSYYNNQVDEWYISTPFCWCESLWLDVSTGTFGNAADKLTLYDGSSNTSTLMHQTSENHKNIALTSTSHHAFITFTSDSSNTGTGFNVKFAGSENQPKCNGTNVIQGIPEGVIQSDNYPNGHYSHSQTCVWKVEFSFGYFVWLELRIGTIEPTNDFIAIYDGDSELSPEIILKSTNGFRASFITTSDKVYIVFKSDSPYISGSGFEIFFRQALYVSQLSFDNGDLTDWSAYVETSTDNSTTQPDGSILLVPNQASRVGALWSKIEANLTDFIVKFTMSLSSNGTGGNSFGIFFLRNETIVRPSGSTSFGVDLASVNYGGLAVFGTSTSIFGSFDLPGSGNLTRSICNYSRNFQPPACNSYTSRQNFELVVSLTSGTYLTVTFCPNATGCQTAAIADAELINSIQSLEEMFIFGIGATNTLTNYDSVSVERIQFYSASTCEPGCANFGVCVGENQCFCREGWTGPSCEEPICPGGCLNGGSCEYPNLCSCPVTYTDPNCATPICSPNCVHGNCSAPDICTCEIGWNGTLCENSICAPLCHSLGGVCTSPDQCTCNEGWTGTLCDIPICTFPCLNNGNCTMPDTCTCDEIDWTGSTANCSLPVCTKSECGRGGICEAPHYCVCKAGWVNDSICDTPICSQPCLNSGVCTEPETCACVVGFKGPQCETASTYFTAADLALMTDDQLLNSQSAVQNAVKNMAGDIAKRGDPDEVTGMLGTLDFLLSRYSNVSEMSPERFADIAAVCSAAADGMMMSATGGNNNGSDADTGISMEEGTFKCKVDKKGDVKVVKEDLPKPGPDAKEKLRKMFNTFTSMLINMFSNLRAILKPGSNMTFSGEFYGAVVFLYRLKDLPGISIDSTLARAELARVDDPAKLFGTIPSKCSALTPDSVLPVVMSAFIVNVVEVDKPFNMPTIAIRFYCGEQVELPCSKDHPARITAKPSTKKAALFASQKVDAQCDISKAKCDLSSNADQIGSLAKFPLTVDAGDFVTIFPTIEYNYTAYLSINIPPKATSYLWLINATKDAVVVTSNNTYAAPRDHNNKGADYRFIIPEKAIKQFALETKSNSSVVLYVYTKKDLAHFGSLDDLPMSACELQRVFGYHLRIGLAKSGKSKRAVDSSTVDGFQLEPESTESAVVFKSSYFGDFGSDLVVSPNTIEFSDIFANFATLLANNAAVFAFQVVAVVFFIVGILFAFKFDKEDLREWAFLPIVSNQRHQTSRYLISVHCSRVKNFKLEPRISIRLIGSVYDTIWRRLDDGIRKKIFNGKHPANFTLTTKLPIGRIDAIELEVESNTGRGNKQFSIHVDRVVVVDAEQGLKYVFLVKSTLREGDKTKRELATEDEMKGYAYLVTGHSKTSFTDIHPWLSIAQRPLASNWTRCERLACVVSALFMAMLVNAMFYGKEGSSPKSVGIKVGNLFTLSWFSVWVGFIGCVIVIPPTFIIGFIFKKVKRRSAEKSHWVTVFNMNIASPKLDPKIDKITGDVKKSKRPIQLPYWTVIIAWILVAACVGVSSFMVIMYSLSWGSDKSIQWLSGMILSVFQDILLVQPIKVFLTAVVSATIHNLPDDGLQMGKLVYNPRNNRRKVELYFKLRGVLTGIFHHAIYVFIFAVVIATMTNRFAYLQVNVLKNKIAVLPSIQVTGTVSDPSAIFNWLEWSLIPGLMSGNQVDKGLIFSSPNTLYSTFNPNVALLGPIRLRQQRVARTVCPLMNSFSGFNYATRYAETLNGTCQKTFSNFMAVGDSSEQQTFNGSWNTLVDPYDYFSTNGRTISNLSYFEAPWVYRATDDIPYTGWEASYKSGGYYVDMPLKLKNALTIIRYLRSRRWLDNSTTMFMVDFNLFNPQTSNLFIPVRVVFEALSAGGMTYHARLFPLQLYQYSGASSLFVFLVQGLWVVLLISHVVRVFRSIKKEGFKNYRSNGWNILDIIQILFGLAIVGLFAFRIYFVIQAVERIQTMTSEFYNLDLLANWEDLMFCLFGIEFFLAMMLFFRHLSVNKHWAVLLATLSKGKLDLASYGAIFAIATILFAGIAYLVMGQTYWNFSNYSRAILTLIEGIIGSVNFANLTSRFYLFLVMVYTAVVLFLGTNMFVTLILSAYSDVTVNVEKQTNWDAELATYLADGVRSILTRKKHTNVEPPKSETFRPVGDKNFGKLELVIHRLAKLAEEKIDAEINPYSRKSQKCQFLWAADQLKSIERSEKRQLSGKPSAVQEKSRRSSDSRRKMSAPNLRIIQSGDSFALLKPEETQHDVLLDNTGNITFTAFFDMGENRTEALSPKVREAKIAAPLHILSKPISIPKPKTPVMKTVSFDDPGADDKNEKVSLTRPATPKSIQILEKPPIVDKDGFVIEEADAAAEGHIRSSYMQFLDSDMVVDERDALEPVANY